MEQVIGATELRQQLTDVLQAVREQRATYIVETFGRSQAAIVNLEDYQRFRRFQEQSNEPRITSADAKRRAQGYLTDEVALTARPGEPNLIGGTRPVWRMPVWLHLRGLGLVERLGSIDVETATGEVVPLSSAEIQIIQDIADAAAHRLTSQTAPAG